VKQATRTVFVTNIPTPYRTDLFNELASQPEVDLHVLFTSNGHPQRRRWSNPLDRAQFNYSILPNRTVEARGGAVDIAWKTRRTLGTLDPDIVVLCGWDQLACWTARKWCLDRAVPYATWTESSRVTGQRRGHISAHLRRRFLGRASICITPGRDAATFVLEHYPSALIAHVPNSVEASIGEVGSETTRSGCLFIGELSERKGVDALLRAAEVLVAKHGRLTIAGHGPMEADVRIMQMMNPGVSYIGTADSTTRASLLSQHAVLLLPSRRDPWPLVPVEALTAGMPVVLGPGVGSRHDLEALDHDAVAILEDLSVNSIVEAVGSVQAHQPNAIARQAFTPPIVAQAMIDAVVQACVR